MNCVYNKQVPKYRSYILLSQLFLVLLFACLLAAGCRPEGVERDESDEARLQVVLKYADKVLDMGRDRWSGKNSPLFADGLNVDTGEPITWLHGGEEYIVSNLASQQNLFRVLTGLSNLTGEQKYKKAAMDAIQYHFDHLLSESGLLKWGGHVFIDLKNLKSNGEFSRQPGAGSQELRHELKSVFPFYELMAEVDHDITVDMLRAIWNAHVDDWSIMEMNRHGDYDKQMGALWNNHFAHPDPFYTIDRLPFINIGADLIYAAGLLHDLEQEEGALTWARHLANLYVRARHPDTGLGAYQFGLLERQHPLPEGPLPTSSSYGDRATNQLGPEFGNVAREAWTMWSERVDRMRFLYVQYAYMMLGMADAMGESGKEFLESTADGLEAYAQYGYVAEENHFRPMWADGTDLTGYIIPRSGYYEQEIHPREADHEFLMVYSRVYRLSEREKLWEIARDIAQGLGIGDIGRKPGDRVNLDMNSSGSSPEEIFALIELYRASPHPQYLERARIVANRLIAERYHNGFFLPGPEYINAQFDTIDPLAILSLDVILRGEADKVPAYMAGAGESHGYYDGIGRTRERLFIWPATRD